MRNEQIALAREGAPRKRPARRPMLRRLVRGRFRAPALADVIRREMERVQKEMRALAITLGLRPGRGAGRAATHESSFWFEQLPKNGGLPGPGAWREFQGPVGVRVRCLDAYAHLAWMLTSASEDSGYTRVEWAASIDESLEVLRQESSKAGPPPRPAIYRRYLKRQEIKERIEKLTDELKSCEAS